MKQILSVPRDNLFFQFMLNFLVPFDVVSFLIIHKLKLIIYPVEGNYTTDPEKVKG